MGDETDTVSSMQSVVVRFAEQIKLSFGENVNVIVNDDSVNAIGHIDEYTWNNFTFTMPVNGPCVIIEEISISLDTPLGFGIVSLEPLLSGQLACCDLLSFLLKKNQQIDVNECLNNGQDMFLVRFPLMRSIDRILPAFDIISQELPKIITKVSFKLDASYCLQLL
jgi:hypothetical protein